MLSALWYTACYEDLGCWGDSQLNTMPVICKRSLGNIYWWLFLTCTRPARLPSSALTFSQWCFSSSKIVCPLCMTYNHAPFVLMAWREWKVRLELWSQLCHCGILCSKLSKLTRSFSLAHAANTKRLFFFLKCWACSSCWGVRASGKRLSCDLSWALLPARHNVVWWLTHIPPVNTWEMVAGLQTNQPELG